MKHISAETRAKMSAAAKRRWEAGRDNMCACIEEGLANAVYRKRTRGNTQKGGKRGVTVAMPDEMLDALNRLKRKTGKSIAEIIRTYIEWGLEDEGVGT